MFKIEFFLDVIWNIIPNIGITLKISFISLIVAFVLALVLAIVRQYEIWGLNTIAKVYISFFRSTPIISQLFLFYFGLAQISTVVRTISGENAVILALAANAAAFMCESIRGAFLSVDKGQIEAGFSIGMTNVQIMRRIILPQAIRVAIPPLSNDFITLTKSTSIAFTVGIIELMGKARMEAASSYRYMEAYAAVLCVYWVIIAIMSFIQRKIELRLKQSY